MLQEEEAATNTMHEGQEAQELAPLEVGTQYVWTAIYTDDGEGETLPEYERNRHTGEVTQHAFSHIDLIRCRGLVLQSLSAACRDISVKITPEEGMRPIFFRRHPTEFDFITGEVRKLAPIHVLGWQRTVAGQNVSSYVYIFPDGSLLLSDRHDAV